MALLSCLPGYSMQTCPKVEVVLSPGMRITATTPAGTIAITAGEDFLRSYTWEGATRSVEMWPRGQRWYGSLGLYYPGPGEHWEEHNGITRGVLEEGQQRFKSVPEALTWLHERTWMPYVYRNDGLVVGWRKTLPRKQLDVEVWQLLINGKKPQKLPGSQDDKIVVSRVRIATPPLVRAVQKDDTKAVKALLEGGSDPNIRNGIGTPVLILAARNGSTDIVEALLDKGADVNARDQEGSTALLDAAAGGHVSTVQALLRKGADVNAIHEKGMEAGMTPLMTAAMMGYTEIARVLLDKGADVNVKTEQGLTALQLAKEHPDIVRLLKEAGAKE
jgi:hypothetical protein